MIHRVPAQLLPACRKPARVLAREMRARFDKFTACISLPELSAIQYGRTRWSNPESKF